jgi:hypothetical protein
MTQHVELNHGQVLTDGLLDPIQELLGAASPNFRVTVKNATTLAVVAATDNGQMSIAINGRYRWRTTETTAALPGGLPDGTHPVFVTASANDFTGPIENPDKTVHTFGLEIKKTGETPSSAHYREVGKVTVASGAITGFEQLVSSVSGAQIASGALSGSGDLTWAREQSGAWVPTIKASAVTRAKLAPAVVQTVRQTALEVGASSELTQIFTFPVAFPDANFTVSGMLVANGGVTYSNLFWWVHIREKSKVSIRFKNETASARKFDFDLTAVGD